MHSFFNANHAQQALLLRHTLLLQLAAASPVPLPVPTLQEGLRLSGHSQNESSLIAQLDYLCDKGHISLCHSELAPALRRYRLNAAGRDYLESQGLI